MAKIPPQFRSALLGAAFLALAGVVVYARWSGGDSGETPSPPSGLFGQFDRDGNGIARLSEVAPSDRKQFEAFLKQAGQTELGALTRAQFQRVLHGEGRPPNQATERVGKPQAAASRLSGKLNSQLSDESDDDRFARLDIDGDGLLSREEFADLQDQTLAVLEDQPSVDDNPAPKSFDGVASVAARPMPAPKSTPAAPTDVTVGFLTRKLFEKLDNNQDKALAPTEIPHPHQDRLLGGDADRDGRLTLAEFAAVLGDDRPARSQSSGAGGIARAGFRGGLVTRPAMGQAIPVYRPTVEKETEIQASAGVPAWFAEHDANRDKQVAQSEWPAAALNEFQRLDINNDGFISLAEAAVPGRDPAENPNP